jgi:hypothetical protein
MIKGFSVHVPLLKRTRGANLCRIISCCVRCSVSIGMSPHCSSSTRSVETPHSVYLCRIASIVLCSLSVGMSTHKPIRPDNQQHVGTPLKQHGVNTHYNIVKLYTYCMSIYFFTAMLNMVDAYCNS